jgi:hypothetical protein
MHAVMNTDDGIRVVDADEPGGEGVRLSVVSARSSVAADPPGLDCHVHLQRWRI